MSNKLAFVIEDDFDGSMVFAKAVEANGLEPEQIMTGNRALERLAESVPTLVVLDLHLPNVPGPDILKKIRADERLGETLVVVVTADPRMADVIREEADLVLLKPTTFSQVRDLVGRLLALRERTARVAAAHPEPAAAPPAPVPTAAEMAVVHPEVAEAAAKPADMPSSNGDGAARTDAPAAAEPTPAPAAAELAVVASSNGAGAAQTDAPAAPAKHSRAAKKSAEKASAEKPAEAPVAADKPAGHGPSM